MSNQKKGIKKGKFLKNSRRSFRKHGLLILNACLIVTVTSFVWVGHNSATSVDKSFSLLSQENSVEQTSPLDTLSSADIAANVALAVGLPQEVMVVNQADSYKAQVENATTTEESVVTKPQIVSGAAASLSDIFEYTSQEGDTLSKLATKFNVTSDTIKWSNALTTENIPANTKLKIPPVNGVIYTVKSSDTVDSIVAKYSADKDQTVAFNDIELTGIKKDDTLFIPGGKEPAPTPSRRNNSGGSASTFGFVARYGGNGYSYGYCTWYAANRVAVPNNWGNANTWDNYARSSGWTVSKVPKAGAVAQTDAMSWWGHVAYVEEVSEDGSMIRYSDMNGLAGWNRAGISGWVPASTYQNYIYQ